MRVTLASILLPVLAAAQNAFSVPDGGYGTINAGDTVNLKWGATTGGTVTLVLRSGSSQNLSPGSIIQANVPNSGNYAWHVPANLAKGDAYTVQIVDDANPNIYNFTPSLTIDSDVSPDQASSVTGSVTLTGASSAASSDASSTAATSTGASSTPAPTTTGASSTGSRSSTASSASAQSTIANGSTGGAWRAMPTGFVGAVGAVAGAAAFVL